MKFAIVVFPGSNCDHDAYHAAKHVLGQDAEFVWHKDTSLRGADVVILPGGFSHGDYLRTGAIARFSPVMAAVAEFARQGGPVLGICNGFQILLEAGLLPGRDAAQPRPEVPLRAGRRPRRADGHAVHAARVARPGAAAADRARRRQLLRRPRGDRRARVERPHRLPLLRRAGRRSPTPPIRTARSTTSPASATRGATSSA